MSDNWLEIKSEINKETKKIINGRLVHNNEDVIETFRKFLLFPLNNPALHLDGLEGRVMNALNKILIEGQAKKDNHSYFLELSKVEPFLRKILYFFNQTTFNSLSASRKGLFKFIEALNLHSAAIDFRNVPLESLTNNSNGLDQLAIVYKLRNTESHECDEWTSQEMHANIASVLATYLFIVDKYYDFIHSLIDSYFSETEKDFKVYLENLRTTFENKISRFVHIRGKEDFKLSEPSAIELNASLTLDQEHVERKGTIIDLRNNQVPEKRMFIWGDAGMGKTTSIEYIAYNDAQARLNDSLQPIPVYIALGLLTDKAISIKQTIFNKLEIDTSYGEKLLINGQINLFLDGVNEIPKDDNYGLRTIRHKEIQHLLNTYKSVFIILSNRPQDLNEFREIPVFLLQKMDIQQIREFVRKSIETNPSLFDIIFNALTQDDRLLKIVKTPLMLSRFIEIVRVSGELPKSEGEIIHFFIESLYRREKEEKKDANFDIKKIHRMLRYLGFTSLEKYGTNSGMTEDEILNIFVVCKNKYGFDIDTIYVLEIVTQLNILEKTDQLYTFAHQAYQDYFHSQEEKAIINL